jgi:hypothetical protein
MRRRDALRVRQRFTLLAMHRQDASCVRQRFPIVAMRRRSMACRVVATDASEDRRRRHAPPRPPRHHSRGRRGRGRVEGGKDRWRDSGGGGPGSWRRRFWFLLLLLVVVVVQWMGEAEAERGGQRGNWDRPCLQRRGHGRWRKMTSTSHITSHDPSFGVGGLGEDKEQGMEGGGDGGGETTTHNTRKEDEMEEEEEER